jgi:hypothetical protein
MTEAVNLSTDAKPYGKTLEEWAKEYWQWNVGCHQEISPKMLIII